MIPKIIKANSLNEYSTKERCSIAENYCDDSVSVARARVKPGITTVAHHLKDATEIYLVISGQGKVDVGNLQPTEVSVGDVVVIPAGTSQKITNIGKTDLVFYCICTPKFMAERYCDEEKERKVP